MKVVHIESGIGNQMLSYCELVLLKKLNPLDEFFIETIIYELPECNDVICQWNGYELERIFNIKEKNIKSYFSEEQWKEIIKDIRSTQFWNNWNYPPVFVEVFKKQGLALKNCRGSVCHNYTKKWWSKLLDNYMGDKIKRKMRLLLKEKYIAKKSVTKNMHIITDKNIFTGQWLGMKNVDSEIEEIADEIRKTFIFPEFEDKKNLDMVRILKESNSVAIHARRGDLLSTNGYCYKYGYFKRAVNFIRRNVENPVFVFFTDPDSISWCRQNQKIFGLNFKTDIVYFVDWNKGEESFRDMQLMTYCKHNIITVSSFGWWGAWLNNNPDKITCSPNITINTTHHF